MFIDFRQRGGGAGGGISDAPVDGKLYGRKDADWVEVKEGKETLRIYVPSYDFLGNITKYDITDEQRAHNAAEYTRWEEMVTAGEIPTVIAVENRSLFEYPSVIVSQKHKGFAYFCNFRQDGVFFYNANLLSDGNISNYSVVKTNEFVERAPTDGKLYGRKDAHWVEVKEGISGFYFWVPRLNPGGGHHNLTIDQETHNKDTFVEVKALMTKFPDQMPKVSLLDADATESMIMTYNVEEIILSNIGFGYNFYMYTSDVELILNEDGTIKSLKENPNKQAKLESGTNIKTINGESILGEGNLEVGGSNDSFLWLPEFDSTGAITKPLTAEETAYNKEAFVAIKGNLGGRSYFKKIERPGAVSVENYWEIVNIRFNNTSAVMQPNSYRLTALSILDNRTIDAVLEDDGTISKINVFEYQEKLVSATNIKTINGESILGTGDLAISGGGSVDAYTKAESDAKYDAKPVYLYIPERSFNEAGEGTIAVQLNQDKKDKNKAALQAIKNEPKTRVIINEMVGAMFNKSYNTLGTEVNYLGGGKGLGSFEYFTNSSYIETVIFDEATGDVTKISRKTVPSDVYSKSEIDNMIGAVNNELNLI